MTDLAVSGSTNATFPSSNVFHFLFSDPFHHDNEVFQHAPDRKTRQHSLPAVSLHKPFLVNPTTDVYLTFGQARLDALKIAASLKALVDSAQGRDGNSTTVLIHLPNCLEYAPVLFGIFAGGLIATLANPGLSTNELRWILDSARPNIIVTSTDGLRTVESALAAPSDSALKQQFGINHIFVVDVSIGQHESSLPTQVAQIRTKPWSELLKSKPLSQPVSLSDDECWKRTALILWSSGTSGKSKGVKLSHGALVASLVCLWHANLKYSAEEKWLGFVPFYHVFGLCNILLLAPCCGATVHVMSKFDPKQMLDLVPKKRITFLHIAPPVALILAKSPMIQGLDFSSLKGACSGGAPLGKEAIELVNKRIKVLITMASRNLNNVRVLLRGTQADSIQGYGMSEAAGICTQHADSWEELVPQLGSTGLPMFGAQLRIVSTTNPTQTLKKHEEGEILIRSSSLMLGYLNNESATSEAIDSEGWLHTGDVGKLDDNGYLWITDRLKEVIKVKGLQVSPSDLEAILCSSPRIADAGVTAIYDSDAGTELPRAYIVAAKPLGGSEDSPVAANDYLADLAQHVKSWTEERSANYKWLRGNIVFIKEIPKSPSGKILRRLLKAQKGHEVVIYAKKVYAKL